MTANIIPIEPTTTDISEVKAICERVNIRLYKTDVKIKLSDLLTQVKRYGQAQGYNYIYLYDFHKILTDLQKEN